MKDRIKQSYQCSYFKQSVFVQIGREICEREVCTEPRPHITEQWFETCSDRFNCGVAEMVDGEEIRPRLHLCPAHRKLSGRESL